jgi:predicted RNA-binding Zn ribbon-like protein
VRVRHPDGQVFTFDAGALCLELSSVTGGEGWRARFEILHTPDDLARWAAVSRLGVQVADLALTEADLALVKRLREAVWGRAYGLVTGAAADPVDTATINEIAGGAPPVPGIGADDGRAWRRPVTGDQLAAAVARDAVVTLTRPAAGRIRMCAADNCYLIFLDTSKPGRRRWCSMDRCGNRAKVRGHRQRKETP